MEYRHLRFFIAVAEELNFTRAAARLRVAQPHLSREIRRLESELEISLFARDRKRVTLTAAGGVFLERVRRVLAETDEAVRTARRADRGETGLVRVGFASSAGFGLFPDVVRRFRLERPEVELVPIEFNSDEQPDLLRRQALDACLLHPPQRPEQGLETETLLTYPLVAALPEGHRLAGQDRIMLKNLAAEPWILFRRAVASRLHDVIVSACNDAGFPPRVIQEALKLSTIVSLVASGLGVSLVPVTLTRLQLPRLVYRPVVAPVPLLPLAMMWRRGDPNPALKPLLDAVRKEARHFNTEARGKSARTSRRARR